MEKPIIFKNKRDKQLLGILHLLKEEGKFPLVIFCHGFGASKSRYRIVRLCRALAKNNIACFRFDFEGCGDSEGDLKDATLGNEVEDLKSAIDFVLKQKNIDKTKISFVAESFGVLVVLLHLVKTKFSAKTLVFWAPALNQKELIKNWFTKKEIEKWKKQKFITKKEKIMGIDYLKENQDKDYSDLLSKIQTPILIIHGAKDETVPLKFSKNLAKKCRNIKLKIYPKAEHKFEDYCIQQELIKDTIGWIKKISKS